MADSLDTSGRLSGRTAIVTGAASGIGRATAELFGREGSRVVAVDIDRDGAESAAAAIQAAGGEAIAVHADLTSARACASVVDSATGSFKRLHVLCNIAGVVYRATVPNTTEQDWDRVMDVNVKAVYLMCRAAIPVMHEVLHGLGSDDAGSASIVNAGSGWGLVGGSRAAVYCASKGAVVQLARAMAIDHGSSREQVEGAGDSSQARRPIRVNCVCPGDTDTPLLHDEARQLGAPTSEFFAEAGDRPLGRVGSAEEIARAFLYLASDESSFVTGTTLVVDGGGLAS